MKKHEMPCRMCQGSGLVTTGNGQVHSCGPCMGSGAVSRPERGPQDYVFEYTIPASGTITLPPLTILSWDFLLKWLVAYSATPTDQIVIKDNSGYTWMNGPVQLQNWAGSGQLPFPVQPNLLLVKNTTLTITMSGTTGHTGEIVLKGISLLDIVQAAPATQ